MISEVLAFLAGFATCKVYVSFFVNTGNYAKIDGCNNSVNQVKPPKP